MVNKLSGEALEKLQALNNQHVIDFVEKAIALCKPDRVTVITDSKEDIDYIRNLSLANGEEHKLAAEGHTYHFDSKDDQGRDKKHTAYLVSKPVDWGMDDVNSIDKASGIAEINKIMDGIMKGKEMLVAFFCLGPTNSKFSLPALQITDSAYVVHSETILYRAGYEQFKKLNGSDEFFRLIHSAGELENGVTKNIADRRIYIDLEDNTVYTCNNQYAGNSVGLKKLCFRLSIQKAHNEGWLAEHMFLMGVHGKPGRVSYFSGAFPSACGKTSTAMIPGQTIVGDDIAFLKKDNGRVKAVNVEQGIFGIIKDVNGKDDPVIYQSITTPREVIFSNVLISEGKPYWLGMGVDTPDSGMGYAGPWTKDSDVKISHPNARFTLRINELENADPRANDPEGVDLDAIVYGGRDSDTTVPVAESLSWEHGVLIGATIESETTTATLGKEGVRTHDPMATLDFISVPLTKYLTDHIFFAEGLTNVPKVYATNYFLKNAEGEFCNSKLDKKVWILWADGRIHGEYEAIKTPVGFIPKFEDVKKLFKDNLNYDYTEKEYLDQFSLRVDAYLAKMERMEKAFAKIQVPEKFQAEFDAQIARLKEAKEKYNKSVISPYEF